MRTFLRPLHLLLFGKPFTYDLIDRRFHKARRNRLLIAPTFAVIGGVWTVCRSGIAGQLCSDHPKAMTQRGDDVSNICRFLPKLTVNGQFMRDFMAEESPCFALGLVEERKHLCGFLALRPTEVIPPEISGLGFNFGHACWGLLNLKSFSSFFTSMASRLTTCWSIRTTAW